jgi:isopropylmalate/homocitrate/citramalate synthase
LIELREPLDALVRSPREFTGGKSFPERVHIYDETLRDGEQMPGVAFSPDQKLELAGLLSDMGVDVLMAAFPASSESDREALRRILRARAGGRLRDDLEIMTIARATRGDIETAARVAREAGADLGSVGVLVLSTASDLHLKYKLGRALLKYKGADEAKWLELPVEWYRRANLDLITDHLSYAAELGFGTVEFASEDASRATAEYLLEWATACRQAGGTRMCFSDTCGVFTPEAVDAFFPPLVEAMPGFPITAHFHNDFGLGAVNTVRALSHGATHASISACGIGERAGNTSIHQVVMVLRELYGVTLDRFRYDRLWDLRRAVEVYSGIPIQPHEPIIGHNVFAHESGMHTAGIEIHPAIYQTIDEEIVGGEHRFVFGKHSGAAGVLRLLGDAGLTDGLTPEELSEGVEAVLAQVKEERETRAVGSDFRDAVKRHYEHLGSLGIEDAEILRIFREAIGRSDRRTAVRPDQ